MDKKILITGARGFIGGHVANKFPKADVIDLIDGEDITDELPDKTYDVVIHLAALKSVPKSEQYAKQFVETNCWGTLNLVRKYNSARFINISSSSADECLSIYGITKRFTELLGSYHKNYLSVRLFNVFGENQYPESGALIPNLIKCKIERTVPVIYGNGMITRDFTYVGDVVNEIVTLVHCKEDKTGVMEIGYGKPISVIEVVKEIFGEDVTVRFKPARGREIQFSCSEGSIKPMYGRLDGLKRTEEWMRENIGV